MKGSLFNQILDAIFVYEAECFDRKAHNVRMNRNIRYQLFREVVDKQMVGIEIDLLQRKIAGLDIIIDNAVETFIVD